MEIEKGTAQGAGICGIILLICGVASSISGFVWIGIHGFGGYGLWSGVGLVVAGILGVVAWWKRNKGVLVGFLVVTIIMIFVASGQGITSGVLYGVFKVYVDPGRCFTSNGICYCRQNSYTTYRYDELFCEKWKDLMNVLLAITIFNVVGAIICLAGSIFGCMGTCCASTQSQPGAVVVQQPVFMTTTTQHGYPAQQPGYAPQQQPGYAPQQQPGYAPQHQPGYAPQQQPGYAPQPEAAYPPPQYTEKH